MSFFDSIGSTNTQEASSGSVLPIDSITALSRFPFDRFSNWTEVWTPSGWTPDIHLVTPALQAFQIVGGNSTLLGYSLEDTRTNSGHFVLTGNPTDENELQARMLKLACHLVVDLTPEKGLREMLDKATEIREYYCSLANWQTPAIADEPSVTVNPGVVSYEREPFSHPEE
jgi:hypothetical protein